VTSIRSFNLQIDQLVYRATDERRIQWWRSYVQKGISIAPIKVSPGHNNVWKVHSGAEAVEAMRREGLTSVECVSISGEAI
jgi:hypothetical protein